MNRSRLKTVRLTPSEERRISGYLRENPLFDGFGSLARVATLEFIASRKALPLRPSPDPSYASRKPPFLWDYDLTESQVRELLRKKGKSRDWLMGRILERAPLPDVLRFLNLEEIRKALPRVRLSPKRKARWDYALTRWGIPG